MKQKQAWTLYKKEEETAIEELCSGYRRFWMPGKRSGNVSKRRCGWQRKKGIGNCRNAGRSNRETKYMRCTAPRPRYFFR